MASPFSSALAKLDVNLQAIHSQLNCLGAALEVNDDQLSRTLNDGRLHAAMLRNLIRAEWPGADWSDRTSLEQLIHEIEAAVEARRNQQLRTLLVDLADELDAGSVRHRFDARAKALNTMRLEAVRELRAEAAQPGRVNELPGPSASEWLHWACGLTEAKDNAMLARLRKDFPVVERFASEMEEIYWTPGREPVRPISAPPAESPSSAPRMALDADDTEPSNLPPEVRAQFEKALQSGDLDQALSLCWEHRGDSSSPGSATFSRPEAATVRQSTTAVLAADESLDESLIDAIAAGPHVKRCENCDCTFPAGFQVCPFDNSALSPIAVAVPVDRRQHDRRSSGRRAPIAEAVPVDLRQHDRRSSDRRAPIELHLNAVQPTPNGAWTSGGETQPAHQPDGDAARDPADLEMDKLKAILVERNTYQQAVRGFEQFWAHKKLVAACSVAATVMVLAAVFHFNGVSASQLRTNIVTAGARAVGVSQDPVQDSDIQQNLEQKFVVLKDSSIQATVEHGVVTLVGRAPTKWESMRAEGMASQADGVKLVKNQVQVIADNLNATKSSRGKRQN